MENNYAYFSLGCADIEPQIVIANVSDGAWVTELVPSRVPEPPIEFYRVSRHVLGPIVHPNGLALVRDDLLEALRDLSSEPILYYPATIRSPRSDEISDCYSVLKVGRSIMLGAITTPAGGPVLTEIAGDPGGVLASCELCELLEGRKIPGLGFSEPAFAGDGLAG